MVPGNTTGAVFVNVKRLFGLYGDLIRKSPGYDKIEEAVKKGLPDPSKDIEAIGLVSNLESSSASAIGVVMTGTIDLPRFMKAAEVESHTVWTASSYRGVTLQSGDVDGQKVQIGQAEGATIMSFDPTGAHPQAKAIIGTLGGSTASFGQVNKLTLPAGWIMNGSVSIPAELSQQAMALGPQFAVLTKIRLASASVIATDATKDGKVALKLTCDTRASATELHGLLMGLAGAFTAGRRGGATDLLNKIQIAVSGASLTLTLDLPRAELEQALGGSSTI